MEALLAKADLDRVVARCGNLVIAVTAAADAASRDFDAAIGEIAARLPGVEFAVLPLPEAAEVGRLVGVERAPGLILFRAGVGLFAGPATADGAWIEALLRRALALDMDAVRAEMSRERAAMAGSAAHRACPMTRRGNFPTDA